MSSAAKNDVVLQREGHRVRLRKRFLENGIGTLHDYEILELLLGYTIQRKDTKQIAKVLLKEFKTITGVLNADTDDICAVEGVGKNTAQFFPFFRELIGYCLGEACHKKSVVANRRDVEEYLRFYFGSRTDEYVAALFLDNGNRVIAVEIIAEGTVNQCALYPRTVIEKALRFHAASIILAHNHPGGSPTPSEADWSITVKLFRIGKLLEIPLHDHIIICSDAVISLRELSRWPSR
jgi:DNA repair protein RadC